MVYTKVTFAYGTLKFSKFSLWNGYVKTREAAVTWQATLPPRRFLQTGLGLASRRPGPLSQPLVGGGWGWLRYSRRQRLPIAISVGDFWKFKNTLRSLFVCSKRQHTARIVSEFSPPCPWDTHTESVFNKLHFQNTSSVSAQRVHSSGENKFTVGRPFVDWFIHELIINSWIKRRRFWAEIRGK